MSSTSNNQNMGRKRQLTAGVLMFHVIIMLGLLIGAIFYTIITFTVSYTMFQTMPIAVMLWIGFALYFGLTEVLPQAMQKFT